MTWILTSRGKHFDYLDPRPADIDILDIARALSCEARFNGHTRAPYYVAQHAVTASNIVPTSFALEALLHDATEAYCKDIPRPLKALLPGYQDIEARVDGAIRAAFGLPPTMSDTVKHADTVMLATERRDLMPNDPTPWPVLNGIEPLKGRIYAWDPKKAEARFIKRYLELTERRRAA